MRTKQQRVQRKEKYLYSPELNLKELQQLLERSDPNENAFGFNALHRSVLSEPAEFLERFELLISMGTDVNSRNEHPEDDLWYTPLHVLIHAGDEIGMVQFIETAKKYNKEIDYNVQDRKGQSLLVLAVRMQFSEGINILLNENNVNLNLPDLDGNTPLHHACANFQIETIHKLLERGVNASLKNSEGKTPLQLLLNPKFNTLLNKEALENIRFLLIQQMKQGNTSLDLEEKVKTLNLGKFN